MKYIGVRSCIGDPSLDIGIKYRSRSKNVEFIKDQQKNPTSYEYEVLQTFDTRKQAGAEEVKLHALYNVKDNPEYYNLANQTSELFDISGKVTVVDIHGKTSSISTTDVLFLNGTLVSIHKGKQLVYDEHGKCISVRHDHPGLISGKFISIHKGKMSARDIYGKYHRISTNDPRFLCGELVSFAKNKVCVKDISGNTYHIDKNDPRYLNGELVSITKDKVPVMDKHGKYFSVYRDNIQYLSGELVHVTTGSVSVKDEDGNYILVEKTDPRYLNGELVGINQGKISITNGIINKLICNTDLIPDGWYKGQTRKKRKWYNNGIKDIMSSSCPGNDYFPGRIKKVKSQSF